jgi:hypothetical protein
MVDAAAVEARAGGGLMKLLPVEVANVGEYRKSNLSKIAASNLEGNKVPIWA